MPRSRPNLAALGLRAVTLLAVTALPGVTLVAGLGAPTVAIAAPSWAPDFDPERRVVVIPEDFRPPGIGAAGLARLEAALQKTQHPFYVVILDHLPPGNSDEDERVRAITDGLAEAWASQGADPAVSSYFALTFQPRKFAMLAGARWKTELDLEGQRLDPFIERFIARVQGTPADPSGGIIDLVEAFDSHVVYHSDPERRAALRLENKRQTVERLHRDLQHYLAVDPEHLPWDLERYERASAELRALLTASPEVLHASNIDLLRHPIDNLGMQIRRSQKETRGREIRMIRGRERLQEELAEARQLLLEDQRPPEFRPYEAALASAEGALAADDAQNLEEAALRLHQAFLPLKAEIASDREDARRRIRDRFLALFAAGLLLAIIIPLFLRYLARRRQRRVDLDAAATLWETRLAHAASRYVDFYGKRDGILGLCESTGRTRELYEAITREVDTIYVAVRAMEAHVAECRAIAGDSGGTLRRLDRAIAALSEPFSFDTGILHEGDLFGPPTTIITLDPTTLVQELEERYKTSLDGWRRLEEVAERQLKGAHELFPHTCLDQLLQSLEDAGIPHAWVADHPLIGDEAADQAVYSTVEHLRWEDPLSYAEAIDSLLANEQQITTRVQGLVTAYQRVTAARRAMDALPPPDPAIVVDPEDDPQIARAEAARALEALELHLATPPAPDRLGPACARAAELATEALQACEVVHTRHQRILRASAEAVGSLEAAARAADDAKAALARDARSLAEARVTHTVDGAEAWLHAADRELASAAHRRQRAAAALAAGRLVTALREAEVAGALAEAAASSAAKIAAHLAALEEARQSYEQQLAELPALRARRQQSLLEYQAGVALAEPDLLEPHGPADYVALLRRIDETVADWDQTERAARKRYFDRQLAAVRVYEAEEAVRRARSSSTTTSWGSTAGRSSSTAGSWRSSSSSSSAGSWGSSSSSSSSAGSWGGSSSRSSSSRSGNW